MTRDGYGQAYQKGLEHTIRFLLSRGITRDTAVDVAQAAWLRGWERLGQLRDERMVVTWVNTIALNHYRRALRYERMHRSLEEPIYSRTTLNWAAIDLGRILRYCRQPDRVLLEAQLDGSTAKEIAEEQGVSQTAIRIRLLRARRAARKAAERAASKATKAQKRRPRPAKALAAAA